jgi:lysine 2,3-aminomutase
MPLPDWQSLFRQSFKDSHQLATFLDTSIPRVNYPLLIPQKLAIKIKQLGPDSSLWKQFVPSELENIQNGKKDPIGDQAHAKGGQLIHRYDNRALFLPTQVCPVLCRYCFRKNELTQGESYLKSDWEQTLSYLENHPEIIEIIFSGGDPLILSDERLRFYLEAFSQIKHIKHIRFHSRVPIILPERITPDLIQLIKDFSSRFSIINLAIHINHNEEWTDENTLALQQLRSSPLQLLSQTVLLKSVNDEPSALAALFLKLCQQGVRPYYLHHPDQVRGGMHFHLPLQKGREIYAKVKSLIPGWALPHYVMDLPGGEGKALAFSSEKLEVGDKWLNRQGELISLAQVEKETTHQ